MAINVFDSFLKEFEQPITTFVSTSVSNLASYIDGPLRVAVMLYVVLYGFAVMRGAISEPIMEFAWRAMRIVVVVLLATNSLRSSNTSRVYFSTPCRRRSAMHWRVPG
jgi:type IV secretion system protein VirB6